MSDAVGATLRGPAHVIEEVSPELEALAGRPMRGLPLAEAFPEDQYQPVIDLCDWASMTRREVQVGYPHVDGAGGTLTLTPIAGGLRATWTGLLAVPRPLPSDEVGLAVAQRILEESAA